MMYMKYNRIYVPQIDEKDCGIACLAMVLKKYGAVVSLAKLRYLAKTTLEGTSALGIVRAAEQLGLLTHAVKADETLFDTDELHFPFIVHMVKNNSLLHYCIVLKNLPNYIVIADPDPKVGIQRISKEIFFNEWTGIAIFFSKSRNFKAIHEKRTNIFSTFKLVLRQKRLVLSITLAAFLLTIINIGSSYFFQGLIDSYIPQQDYHLIQLIAVGLCIAYAVNSVLGYFQDILVNILGQHLIKKISLQYLNHVFELPVNFFETRKIGEITSRFSDVNHITDALANVAVSLCIDVATVITMGVTLSIQSPSLYKIVLLLTPLFAITILAFTAKFRTLDNEQMESNSKLNSMIIEALRGIVTIKSVTGEGRQYKRIEAQFQDYLSKSLDYVKAEAVQSAIKSFLRLFLSIVVLVVGSKMIIDKQMTIGQLITYNSLLSYFIDPLQNIVNLQPSLQAAGVSQKRLNEVMVIPSEFALSEEKYVDTAVLQGEFTLKNVDYQYDFSHKILEDISLKINTGEKIALVGRSGSGKSTLAKLLVNFISPTEGKILLGKADLARISKRTLRSFVRYIPQDPYIFSGTIKENLLLGVNRDVSEQEIRDACKKAEILGDVEKLPAKFDEVLDEGATILSGGQKQRLSIARALLSRAEVLILDEVTSGLDPITEEKVVENLIKGDQTIIFIAHQMKIAQKVDRIFVLDHGKIVESGSSKELFDKKGSYHSLVEASTELV